MNWISNFVRPKLGTLLANKKEMPENLWIKCPLTGEMVFHKDLEANQGVIPSSGYHMKISAAKRLSYFLDDGKYQTLPQPKVVQDPLKFRDHKKYTDRLKENRAKTGMEDSILSAVGKLHGLEVVTCLHEFAFMGGSLGMAAGEAIVKAFEKAIEIKAPLIMFPASGGARMQEGILSLMQLPRTIVMVERLKEAGLPYVVVLTNPTTGGVSASYAMLGDIHIAEPGAEIGFAGKRVIEQAIREKLPEGFQTSEFLQEHGMVDMVVPRPQLRNVVSSLLRVMLKMAPADLSAGDENTPLAAAGKSPQNKTDDDKSPAKGDKAEKLSSGDANVKPSEPRTKDQAPKPEELSSRAAQLDDAQGVDTQGADGFDKAAQ